MKQNQCDYKMRFKILIRNVTRIILSWYWHNKFVSNKFYLKLTKHNTSHTKPINVMAILSMSSQLCDVVHVCANAFPTHITLPIYVCVLRFCLKSIANLICVVNMYGSIFFYSMDSQITWKITKPQHPKPSKFNVL